MSYHGQKCFVCFGLFSSPVYPKLLKWNQTAGALCQSSHSERLNVDSLNVHFHPYINESGFISKEELSLLPQSIYVLIQLFIAVWIFHSLTLQLNTIIFIIQILLVLVIGGGFGLGCLCIQIYTYTHLYLLTFWQHKMLQIYLAFPLLHAA